MIHIDRLSPSDEVLLWPDQIWPQDIGALVLLDGNELVDADGHFRVETVMELVASRIHLVPRFRQLLYSPPKRLGRPLWVDAPAFNINDHILVVPLCPPGDEARLLIALEEVRRRRLDRTRPLWEMCFFTGVSGGRIGLFVRMHHAIADGMAAVANLAAFLDLTGIVSAVSPQSWNPSPPPTPTELLADNRRARFGRYRRSLLSLAHPIKVIKEFGNAWPAISELLAERPIPATSLDRVVGQERRFALIRSSLDSVMKVAHDTGTTVNDVLLAATAGGLRKLFASRGERVEGGILRIYVPVSLHHGPRGQARGNLIGQMVVPLPISVEDPVDRLRLIAAETALRKAKARPSLGILPHKGIAGRMFLKLIDRQKVNVISADIPGPETPFYFAGAQVLEVFAMVQLIGTVSLAVGAISYAGQFTIMVVVDGEAFPDVDVFVEGLREDLLELTRRLA